MTKRLLVAMLAALLFSFAAVASEPSPHHPEAPSPAHAVDLSVAPDCEPVLEAMPDEPIIAQAGCCRICRTGKACGNSCINRAYTCHQPRGCACNG